MSSNSFLNLQYNLSKRRFSLQPSRLLSWRQRSGVTPGYQPSTEELRRVFDRFDSNRDGKISQQEYKVILKALGKEGAVADVPSLFRAADLDGDGFIDFREFVEAHRREGGVRRAEMRSAFRTFDLNGDGRISAEEVMEVMRRLGERCGLEECRRMVRGVDGDGDGLVDVDEFMSMMTAGSSRLC
uniref:EF-hand domain-containing protein n=1 Tax=Kalanchoe fedtschenkoi TaxID=63787 RepID=A0A7N0T1P4_KALFE